VFVELEGRRRHGLVHVSQVAAEVSFAREDEDDDKVKALEFYAPVGSQARARPDTGAPRRLLPLFPGRRADVRGAAARLCGRARSCRQAAIASGRPLLVLAPVTCDVHTASVSNLGRRRLVRT